MPPKRSVDPNVAQVNYQSYMGQVLERLPPVLVESLYDIYGDAVEYCKREKAYSESDRFLIFQRLLKEIKEWDDEEIEEETQRVIEIVPWIRSALQQILISQIHILLSVRNDQYVSRPKFTFDMPGDQEIVHRLLISAARKIRPRVALFDHLLDEYQAESNLLVIEEVVRKSIESAIHSLVPLDAIVNTQYGKKKPTATRKKRSVAAKKKKEKVSESGSGGEAEADAEATTEEGDEILPSEIDHLEKKAERDSEILEEKKQVKRREEENLKRKTDAKIELKLLPNEEHVDSSGDEDEDVEEMFNRLTDMKKGTPERSALRKKLHRYLADEQ